MRDDDKKFMALLINDLISLCNHFLYWLDKYNRFAAIFPKNVLIFEYVSF